MDKKAVLVKLGIELSIVAGTAVVSYLATRLQATRAATIDADFELGP